MGCNKLHLKMIYVMQVHILRAYKLKLELLELSNMRIAIENFAKKIIIMTIFFVRNHLKL